MDQSSSQESVNTAEQLNFVIRRVPKHSTTKLVFENLKISNLLQPVTENMTLIRALKTFTSLQLLDLSSNNIRTLLPASAPTLAAKGDLQLQLLTVISVNLSDNPIGEIQTTIEQLQATMPNVTDLQISLFKEEDVDYIITRMPQLEYLNNLPIERDSTQLSKLQLEIGETPSSLEGITSFQVGSVPDEFDEGLSGVSQVVSLPMQKRVGNSILLTNASNKSRSRQLRKSYSRGEVQQSEPATQNLNINSKFKVTLDSVLPAQPPAEMTSVHLLDTSADISGSRNGFQKSVDQLQNDGSFEQVMSAKFGDTSNFRSPDGDKLNKDSHDKNVYISPSTMSRMTPEKVHTIEQRTQSVGEMNEPANAASQDSYLRQVENSANETQQMSAKSLTNNNSNNFTLNKETHQTVNGVHTTINQGPGSILGKQKGDDSYQSKDTICPMTLTSVSGTGNQHQSRSNATIQLNNVPVNLNPVGHSRQSSQDTKMFAGQSDIPSDPAFIPQNGGDTNQSMPSSYEYVSGGSGQSCSYNTPYSQLRGRVNSVIQNGSRLSTQSQTKLAANLSKSDVEELKGLFQKIRNYRLEKVLSPKGGIGQQQVSETETMLADNKLAKEFENHLKTVTKSLEYRLNSSTQITKRTKGHSQTQISNSITLGMSQADRQIEVLKSKFFLLDVLFEKAVENLRFNPTLIKARQREHDQQIVGILTQIRQAMCQSFVNLAKQQATVAQDIDDVKDLYEQELSARNDEVMKMMDELKSTSYELTKARSQLENNKQQGSSREEQLEQSILGLEKQLKTVEQESDRRSQRYQQQLGEQQIIVEEHKTMLTEHEMTIKEYSQRMAVSTFDVAECKSTIKQLQVEVKQTENEKALEREEFNARRQALVQQLQQTQKEFEAAKEEIKTTTSLLEGSKMWAENLQQQLDATTDESAKKVQQLQKELDEVKVLANENIETTRSQLQEHKIAYLEQQNSYNIRLTEAQALHDHETECFQCNISEIKRALEAKTVEMSQTIQMRNQDLVDLKQSKAEKVIMLKQKSEVNMTDLKQKMCQEFTQIKQTHAEEVSGLKSQMIRELDELKNKQREDIWEMRLKITQDAQSDKFKATTEANEIRQKANAEIVEVKQRTIDDLNALKIKATAENEELNQQVNQLEADNLVVTEKNLEYTSKLEHLRKEYNSYKQDAEHMIEDLHSENSKQTELIVKHSIMVADRQTKLRHKLVQTEPQITRSESKKTMVKTRSQQRLSISSYYETNPRTANARNHKQKTETSIPISSMNSIMVKSQERLASSVGADESETSSIRLNLKQFSQRRSRKMRSSQNNGGTSPHNFRMNSQSSASQGKIPFNANPSKQPNTTSFSSLTRVAAQQTKHLPQTNNPVSPARHPKEHTIKTFPQLMIYQHVSGSKTPNVGGTQISPTSATASTVFLGDTQNLGNMSARPKNNKTIGHGLTLRQTKELIHELFVSKRKSDEQCIAKRQARETMEQHMYNFLNHRYGLKQLIVDWAAALIGAIKHFSPVDHEVNLFGKILKNSIDEEFWLVQLHVKATIQSLIRQQVREKNASKQAKTIAEIASDILSDRVKVEQILWMRIIDRMYEDKDVVVLKQKILEKAQASHNFEQERKQEQMQMQMENSSARYCGSRSRERGDNKRERSKGTRSGSVSTPISYRGPTSSGTLPAPIVSSSSDPATQLVLSELVKVIQDFQLAEHESFLANFMRLFRIQDTDRDGILNPEQFSALLVSMNIGITTKQTESFLQQLDPFCTESIPLSDVVQLLSNQQTTVKQLQQIQESSSWQETSKNIETKQSLLFSGEQGNSPHKLSRMSLMQPTISQASVEMALNSGKESAQSSDNSLVVVSSRKEEFRGMLSSTQEIAATALSGRLF